MLVFIFDFVYNFINKSCFFKVFSQSYEEEIVKKKGKSEYKPRNDSSINYCFGSNCSYLNTLIPTFSLVNWKN